jgi:hypothetical protein
MPHRYRSPVDIYYGVIDIKMIHNTHWNHCKASLTSKDQYRPHSFWHFAMLFLVAGIGPSSIINGTAHYGTHSDYLLVLTRVSLLLFGTNQH